MKIREQYQKLIDRKQQEILDLQLQIEKAKAYMQALQDTMRFIPKDESQEGVLLRPGTALAQAREVLRKAGHPMHVNDILKALNKPPDKGHRVSLSGNLSSYVRNGQIFTRPAPNTFGLIEASKQAADGTAENEEDFDIPEEFGTEN
ncbi:MAG TPA: winged helix-turn-helix domain-containing protein [Terriglobia bacterium]|nr:winged helix-turn-helix domain-containing protein [Terriglobia bacterium]